MGWLDKLANPFQEITGRKAKKRAKRKELPKNRYGWKASKASRSSKKSHKTHLSRNKW